MAAACLPQAGSSAASVPAGSQWAPELEAIPCCHSHSIYSLTQKVAASQAGRCTFGGDAKIEHARQQTSVNALQNMRLHSSTAAQPLQGAAWQRRSPTLAQALSAMLRCSVPGSHAGFCCCR